MKKQKRTKPIGLSNADFIYAYSVAREAFDRYPAVTTPLADYVRSGVDAVRALRQTTRLPPGVRALETRLADALHRHRERWLDARAYRLCNPRKLPLAARYAQWLTDRVIVIFEDSGGYRDNAALTVEILDSRPRAEGGKGPYATYGDYTIWIRRSWRRDVELRGIAVVERRFVLDADPHPDPVLYALATYRAQWVEKGQGFELRPQVGLIVVPEAGEPFRVAATHSDWTEHNWAAAHKRACRLARRRVYEAHKRASEVA